MSNQRPPFWRRLFRQKSAAIGASIVLFFVLIAVLAPVIATYDPRQADISSRLQGYSVNHFFGTDKVGRDVFSRIVYGSRISIKVGLIAMTFSLSRYAVRYNCWLLWWATRKRDYAFDGYDAGFAKHIAGYGDCYYFGAELDKCGYCCFYCLYSAIRANSARVGIGCA